MSEVQIEKMRAVYEATNDEQRRRAYDSWADTYDVEMLSWGFRLPAIASAAFTRVVAPDCGAILDAGCGTGLQSIALAALGYGPITGIDLSEGMLAEAGRKQIYSALRVMKLGTPLDFPDRNFGATFAIGCITPGHAPSNSFDELLRVTRSGGFIVFSNRVDEGQDPSYPQAISEHERTGAWTLKWRTPTFHMMPEMEPEIEHAVFIYEVR